MSSHDRQYIKAKTVLWIGLVFLSLAAGFSVQYLDPLYPIVLVLALIGLFLIIKYPTYGLMLYLIIFLYRPGEIYPVLAPLRLELLLGVLVIVVIIIHQKLRTGRIKIPRDSITLWLVAFLAVMYLSVFSSYEQSATIAMCKEFFKTLIFFFLIVSLVDNLKKFVAFMVVYIVMIGKIAYDAFTQYMSGGFVHAQGIDRMVGTTSAGGDANTIAATMAITIPVVIATLFYTRKFYYKIGLAGLALGMTYLITITGSRGGLLALLGTMIGGFIYARHKFATAVTLLLLLLVGWSALPDQYRERYETMVNVEDVNNTSSGRWEIWQAGLLMVVKRPILGVGAGAFRWAAGSGEFGYSRYMQAHNLMIQLAASTGLIGLIVWLTFVKHLYRKLKEMIRLSNESVKYRWAGLYSKAFMASLLALFVAGSFGHNLYRYNWYMIAGLTVAMINIIQQQKKQEELEEIAEPLDEPEPVAIADQREID